jgi:hypothetical protein
MPWVKLRTNFLEDIRFARLADSAKCRFFELLMLAGKLDAGGYFFEAGHELTDEELAWKLRLQTDALQSDLAALESASLLHRNGRSWCIPGFEEEQGPAQADKRAAWADRQKKHREGHANVTSDNIVTGSNVTLTESESESESDKEKESESIVSLNTSPETTTDDDNSLTLIKTELCKFVGIPAKYYAQLAQDPRIKRIDILAELTRNYARKGQGKGKVGQPGYITAMNLIKHELPPAEWYAQAEWTRYLPDVIQQKCGFVVQSEEEQEDQLSKVAIRSIGKDSTVTDQVDQWWQSVQGQLQMEMPKSSFDTWVRDTVPVHYADGVLQIAAQTKLGCKWLEERLSATAVRLLSGIANQSLSIQFVSGEEKTL